jgi:hypothetical protein
VRFRAPLKPITPASVSANSTGWQSAVNTRTAYDAGRRGSASALGRSVVGVVTLTTSARWICYAHKASTPMASATQVRLIVTAAYLIRAADAAIQARKLTRDAPPPRIENRGGWGQRRRHDNIKCHGSSPAGGPRQDTGPL